jgi:hypothetical protein
MSIIKTEQAAEILECTARNVRYLSYTGKLSAVMPEAKTLLFFQKQVEALAEERKKRKEASNE